MFEPSSSAPACVNPGAQAFSQLLFWLPCNAANFVHPGEDEDLLDKLGAGQAPRELKSLAIPHSPSSSVIRCAVGAIAKRGSGSVAAHRDAAGTVTAIHFTLELPEVGPIELTLTSRGLHAFSSQASDLGQLERAAKQLTELHTPFDLTAGHEDLYIDDKYKGYLPFFQLNILLGGLANPAFRPAVFLEVHSELKQDCTSATLWDAIAPLCVRRSGRSQPPTDDDCDETLAVAVGAFVQASIERHLLPLKWRLERTRRALLSLVLNMIHRKGNLVQVREKLSYPESFEGATTAQLRGYAMLLSSKLPLIHNVTGYLADIAASCGIGAAGEDVSSSSATTTLSRAIHDWNRLERAISENVVGLERAIEQAWMENVLYEQEQTRAEQEALAEIERARARVDAMGTSVDSPIFGFTLMIAFATLWVTTIGKGHDGLSGAGEGLGIGAGIWLVLYLVSHAVRGIRRWQKSDARQYFEFYVSVEEPLTPDNLKLIMSEDRPQLGRQGGPIKITQRGSYRAESMDEQHALFKIHLEGHGRFISWSIRRPLAIRPRIAIFVIFEVLYHRQSQRDEFLLREVRATVVSPVPLNVARLEMLSEEVLKRFVKPFNASNTETPTPTHALFTAVKEDTEKPDERAPVGAAGLLAEWFKRQALRRRDDGGAPPEVATGEDGA